MSRIEEMIRELCPEGVEYKALGEIVSCYTGEQLNKRDMLETGNYPVMNGGIQESGFTNLYNEEENTITISQGGASAGYVNWMKCKFWLGAHCYAIHPTSEEFSNRYMYHFLKANETYIMGRKHGAGIPGLNRKEIYKLSIPVPPIAIQNEIVNILDKFTELEAELEARRKQYEYYRNKLLNFNKFGGGVF